MNPSGNPVSGYVSLSPHSIPAAVRSLPGSGSGPPGTRTSAGYAHRGYAESLAEFGTPWELPACHGWLLARPIPGVSHRDAMGCYPLFCCGDWRRLPDDLEACRDQFLTVALVADPFGEHDENLLRTCFDRVIPFKTHFVLDLTKPIENFTSATHRKFARRAQRSIGIELCSEPLSYLDKWIELYGHLSRRHGITGLRAFSRRAFEQQLTLPGMVMFRATCGSEVVGLDLWYVQHDVAQGHLAALSPQGYDLHAAYGLKLAIIEYFRGKVRWLDLGGAAGLEPSANDGLTAFKRGWASDTRTVWFCGRVFDSKAYAQLVKAVGAESASFFPAYRAHESF